MYGYQTDWVALRKAAQANLASINSGEKKRQIEAQKQAAAARKKLDRELLKAKREEQRERRKHIASLRETLSYIEPEWERLMSLYDAGTISAEDRGALEEYDHQRNQILEEIYKLDR